MKTKGLLVDVYKSPMGDCTNKGISYQRDTLILISWEPTHHHVFKCPKMFSGNGTNSVKIVPGNVPEYVKAIPVKEKSKNDLGPMFGGNFIYSSDSRFPFKYPIPIHDRYE